MTTKLLDIEIFPQGNIASLISSITFSVLFSQEKPLRRKEINTYTHAHTQTHTHTHTRTHANTKFTNISSPDFYLLNVGMSGFVFLDLGNLAA